MAASWQEERGGAFYLTNTRGSFLNIWKQLSLLDVTGIGKLLVHDGTFDFKKIGELTDGENSGAARWS